MASLRNFLLFGYGLAALFVNAWLAPGPAAAAETRRILALGDSLTAGYGLPRAESFPARLEAALRAQGLDVVVVNAGVSGDTTAGGRARLDWALASAGDGGPDAVIVALGGNDGLRGLPPTETRANLDAILARLGQKGLPVLLAGMLAPPNLGAEYGDEFKALYPDLAARHGAILYPFFLDGVAADPALNQDDGIHPNARGVDVIVGRMVPAVRRLLDRAAAVR
ncbi:MAG: arylesterase [Hyphomicrobiales bacterium]|nr:arylesterase [Hyphomicrobiales bacterium]MCP5370314.1 arylesterase [Hyphomicrobiales bacterium]